MHEKIEKSGFRKGEYIGYGKETYRIRKSGKGWGIYSFVSYAPEAQGKSPPFVWRRTLKEIGQFLDSEHKQ